MSQNNWNGQEHCRLCEHFDDPSCNCKDSEHYGETVEPLETSCECCLIIMEDDSYEVMLSQ